MANLHRSLSHTRVYLDGQLQNEAYHVTQINRRLGSGGYDTATVRLQAPLRSPKILFEDINVAGVPQGQEVNLYINWFIEIERYYDASGDVINPDTELLFMGVVTGAKMIQTPQGEEWILDCRVTGDLMGFKVTNRATMATLKDDSRNDAGSSGYELKPGYYPLHFNPVVDGVAVPNMWELGKNPADVQNPGNVPAFIDPDSIASRKLASDRIQGEGSTTFPGGADTALFWTPAHAVFYLTRELNILETAFRNPTWNEILDAGPALQDATLIRDLRIPVGADLGEALTAVLRPFKFDWRLEYTAQGIKGRIVVLDLMAGNTHTFKLQRSKTQLDHNLSEVCEINLDFDAFSNGAKRVQVQAAPSQVQLSIELQPAWSSQYDGYLQDPANARKLMKNDPDWKTDPELQLAWRKFAANEGGDYTGTRAQWFENALDLSQIDSAFVYHRRRRPLPLFSTLEEGRSIGLYPPGVLIEAWDPQQSAWVPIDNNMSESRIKVSDSECAIYFDGKYIPTQMVAWGGGANQIQLQNMKFRLTCVLEGDRTDLFTATNEDSVIRSDLDRVFDMSDQYQNKYVDAGAAIQDNPDRQAVVLAAQGKANMLAQQHANGLLVGSLTIDGIDRKTIDHLGQRVSRIGSATDRNIHLALTGSLSDPQYPHISQITYLPQQQRSVVNLEVPQ